MGTSTHFGYAFAAPEIADPKGVCAYPLGQSPLEEPKLLRRGPAPDRVPATILVTEVVGTAEAGVRLGGHGWGEA